jgi:hypothetical protein
VGRTLRILTIFPLFEPKIVPDEVTGNPDLLYIAKLKSKPKEVDSANSPSNYKYYYGDDV